ncbi:MAG: hypothetical protein R2713_21335 [Ilumatobacteraceae bacterium]
MLLVLAALGLWAVLMPIVVRRVTRPGRTPTDQVIAAWHGTVGALQLAGASAPASDPVERSAASRAGVAGRRPIARRARRFVTRAIYSPAGVGESAAARRSAAQLDRTSARSCRGTGDGLGSIHDSNASDWWETGAAARAGEPSGHAAVAGVSDAPGRCVRRVARASPAARRTCQRSGSPAGGGGAAEVRHSLHRLVAECPHVTFGDDHGREGARPARTPGRG